MKNMNKTLIALVMALAIAPIRAFAAEYKEVKLMPVGPDSVGSDGLVDSFVTDMMIHVPKMCGSDTYHCSAHVIENAVGQDATGNEIRLGDLVLIPANKNAGGGWIGEGSWVDLLLLGNILIPETMLNEESRKFKAACIKSITPSPLKYRTVKLLELTGNDADMDKTVSLGNLTIEAEIFKGCKPSDPVEKFTLKFGRETPSN
ncbi:MAG: hypothetical protein A3J74_00930 [Elusimicrobia bacterium RIFCSPHIGHO2_02_FULL_57_9]|nr:MAG: hypothetical protein A3J74_00930 [Elusimicrobia bacterium RIFCSPHIGHO2_02_FULL_57_9]